MKTNRFNIAVLILAAISLNAGAQEWLQDAPDDENAGLVSARAS